jgi:2-keto-3-deoxy-galactonokinase
VARNKNLHNKPFTGVDWGMSNIRAVLCDKDCEQLNTIAALAANARIGK